MKYYKTKLGYFYKEYKNGKKNRISKQEFMKYTKCISKRSFISTKYYKTDSGYYYKQIKSGKKIRISKDEFIKQQKKKTKTKIMKGGEFDLKKFLENFQFTKEEKQILLNKITTNPKDTNRKKIFIKNLKKENLQEINRPEDFIEGFISSCETIRDIDLNPNPITLIEKDRHLIPITSIEDFLVKCKLSRYSKKNEISELPDVRGILISDLLTTVVGDKTKIYIEHVTENFLKSYGMKKFHYKRFMRCKR